MTTTWTIARREIGSYFASPIAYIVLAGFALLTGLLFFNGFFVARVARMDAFFGALPLVFMFFAPALGMRLLAEERGAGTIELLLTMPVRDREVVIGKYVAALALLAVALVATLPFAITVSRLGALDWGPVVGGYLGAFLLGGLYLAVALFASAITRTQVVAFVVGLVACFGIYALGWMADGQVMQYASPQFHIANMTRGFVELRSLIYFASAIAIFLVLSAQALEARKWR